MRNRQYDKEECVAVIGSMTQAMRAQGVLSRAAIRTEVIKADSSKLGRGCAYALSYPCMQRENLKRVLRDSGIRVRSFYGGRNDLS